MADVPSDAHQIDFDLLEAIYIPPDSWDVVFDIDDEAVSEQYLTPLALMQMNAAKLR